MDLFRLHRGAGRLLVSIPHAGTFLPGEFAGQLTPAARALPDTDWHVDRLYDCLDGLDATVLVATHSRYVVDLNRPADDAPLYPGQAGSGVCPLASFEGDALYRPGAEPDEGETRRRIAVYWRPWHDTLRAELARLRGLHDSIVLWDAHSIASRVPALFDGELPVLNLGTWDGRACHPALAARLQDAARRDGRYSAVLNGRFTGGYITRGYGDPANGIDAVQLELARRSYMDEAPPFDLHPDKAAALRPLLRALLEIAAGPPAKK